MNDINLQEICKELHIYEFGIASWPLPELFYLKATHAPLLRQMWRQDY